MSDRQRSFTIQAHVSHARWPGGGVFCTKVSAPKFFPDMFYLVDRNDRVSELRVYKFRMFRRRP